MRATGSYLGALLERFPLVSIFLFSLIGFNSSFAGGGSQPEFRSFGPATNTELVEIWTGDLQYSVPKLLELPANNGSYPIALSYRSSITMDQEPSWVGLGWTLGVGHIQVATRALPDVFDGDEVEEKSNIERHDTYRFGLDANVEAFGLDFDELPITPRIGLELYYDNYRGLGFSRTVGLSGQIAAGGLSSQVALDLSLDSNDGLTAAPSLSINDTFDAKAEINSVRGTTGLTVGVQEKGLKVQADLLSFLGFGGPTTIPSGGMEKKGWNVQVMVKTGGEVWGVFGNVKPYGSYTREDVKDKGWRKHRAYGYLHHENADENSLVDFNREKDGPLYDNTPTLGQAIITPDLFTVSGDGIGGTFRAFRNDIPVVFDRRQESRWDGAKIAVDLGTGAWAKLGADGSINSSTQVVSRWSERGGAALLETTNAAVKSRTDLYQPYYFRFIGEPTTTADNTGIPGNELPVGIPLYADGGGLPPVFYKAGTTFKDAAGNDYPIAVERPGRASRSNVVQSFTNNEIAYSKNALPDLYIEELSMEDRKALPGHHIGAFRITTPDGKRYIYALPIYNLSHEEHQFSVSSDTREARQIMRDSLSTNCAIVTPTPAENGEHYTYAHDGTEKYLHIKKLPKYPTTYLLTAVLGPDYADNGDSKIGEGDSGFWVTFSYEKKPTFRWRDPFFGARFVRGFENGVFRVGTERLNHTAQFSTGERENWVLTQINSASHRAVFASEQRSDGHGAPSRLNNAPYTSGGGSSYYLKTISLFSKPIPQNPVAIKKVVFHYDWSLTKGVPNNPSKGGKLTLKGVHFEEEFSTRGKRTPYEFDYGPDNDAENPSFAYNASDRWDSFSKPSISVCAYTADTGPLLTAEARYTPQPKSIDDTSASDRSKAASAWTLKSVVEPTGRRLKIDYESDDYLFVQDRPAMQMYPIYSVDGSASPKSSFSADRRVYVQVPERSLTKSDFQKKYLDDSGQIYFRVRIELKTYGLQTVSGYAKATACDPVQVNSIWLGCVEFEESQGYHPFRVAAWQHLRLQQPELISSSAINGSPDSSLLEEAAKVLTMVDWIESIGDLTHDIYKQWDDDEWASSLRLENSWVRMKAAGGRKFGGGARVRQITFDDAWDISTDNNEPKAEYGLVYEYRLPNGDSSGVASNEPFIGGEENALRRAKPFQQKVLLSSGYNLVSEGPVLESFYPAANVGYSRVTVRSLASTKIITAASNVYAACTLAGLAPKTCSYDSLKIACVTTPTATYCTDTSLTAVQRDDLLMKSRIDGPTVHEFFTSKMYPVRSSETVIEKKKNPQPRFVIVPFLGMLSLNSVAASQGFVAIINEMNGKLRKVSNYEYSETFDPSSGDFGLIERRSTEYVYKSTGFAGSEQRDLANDIASLKADAQVSPSDHIGVDQDFYIDSRHHKTQSWNVGARFNVDVVVGPFGIPIPLIVPIPALGFSLVETKSLVASKVIHKVGVLTEVRERDGSQENITQNLMFDEVTGRPLLTSSTNAFGDPIFQYSMPARWAYPRMGMGYLNLDVHLPTSSGTLVNESSLAVPASIELCADGEPNESTACLNIGDEFALRGDAQVGQEWEDENGALLTLVGVDATQRLLLQSTRKLTAVPSELVLVRSGKRNQLNIDAGAVQALSNPVTDRDAPQDCHWTEEATCEVPCYNKKTVQILTLPVETFGDSLLKTLKRSLKAIHQSNVKLVSDSSLGKYENVSTELNQIVLSDRLGQAVCRVEVVDQKGVLLNPRKLIIESKPRYEKWEPIRKGNHKTHYTKTAIEVRYEDSKKGFTGYLFADCSGWVMAVTEYVPTFGICPVQRSLTFPKLKDVLEAKANTFKDVWPDIQGGQLQYSAQPAQALKVQPTAIWRPWKSYVYVDTRRQSTPVNIRTDGAFDDVLMFNWTTDMLSSCAPKWRMRREITKYGTYGTGTEDRNTLNIFSARLMGYGGLVPIVGATNATTAEIGFEGFEEYEPSAIIPSGTVGSGNISIDTTVEEPQSWYGWHGLVGKWNGRYFISNPIRKDVLARDDFRLVTRKGSLEAKSQINQSTPYKVNADAQRSDIEISDGSDASATPHADMAANARARRPALDPLPAMDGRRTLLGDPLTREIPDLAWTSSMQRGGLPMRLSQALSLPDPTRPLLAHIPELGLTCPWIINEVGNGPNGSYAITFDNPMPGCDIWIHDHFDIGKEILVGIPINHNVEPPSPPASLAITNVKAHTGKHSLKVNQAVTVDQPAFSLLPGKKYVVGAWVSRQATDTPTYSVSQLMSQSGNGVAPPPDTRLGLRIDIRSETGEITANWIFEPSGPIIEGWQRIEGTFVVPQNMERFAIGFQNGNTSGEPEVAYFDDLRLFPSDGTMEAYVYSKQDFRMVAKLDSNWFATYFSYGDGDGDLTLVRRETERGILTTQEARKHFREREPLH